MRNRNLGKARFIEPLIGFVSNTESGYLSDIVVQYCFNIATNIDIKYIPLDTVLGYTEYRK